MAEDEDKDPADAGRDDARWFDLITTEVVGIKHRGQAALAVVRSLDPAQEVRLEREPTNNYDPNAIKVHATSKLAPGGTHIGYLPATQAAWLGAMMDNGLVLRAFVEYVNASPANPEPASVTVTLRLRKGGVPKP